MSLVMSANSAQLVVAPSVTSDTSYQICKTGPEGAISLLL